ncbi:MAG: AsmA family protein [Rhodobacteraceae bacterium]|nr:AsmA family protein [Paracoccaceae bacterium]
MRWIIRIAIVLLALLAIAIGALFLIPSDRIIALVGDQFQNATGRTLVVSGKIRPSIYPALGLYVEEIEIGNPAWVEEGPMLRAERLDIGVALRGLFSGDVRVQKLELTNPEIILIKNTDGAVSWEFGSSDDTSQHGEDGGLAGFSLDEAKIVGGSVLYRDLTSGIEYSAEDLALTLHLPSPNQTFSLEGHAGVNGTVFSFATTIEGIGPLLEGEATRADVELGWDGGEVGFGGLVGLSPMVVNGDLSVDTRDLGPLMSLAGQSAPELPLGLGRDHLAAAGKLAMDAAGAIHLSEMNLVFDDNRLLGAIDVSLEGERPMIRARLQGDSLDLSGLTGGEGGVESPAGWSRDTIDVSALHSVDADVALTLAGLDLGVLTLGSTDIHAGLTAGRMVVNLRNVTAYGGSVSGEYVINGRGGLSMGGDLNATNVQLKPLLTEFADLDRLEGLGSGHVKFLVIGNDMNTLMNSLSGSGAVEFGQGAILGLDIGGMLLNLDTSYQGEGQKTVYNSVTASFTMEAGVVSNDDLIMVADFGELTGSGTVGVGRQVLDYSIIPRVLYTEGDQNGLRVPLLVTGSWGDPEFNLDLEALAEQELSDELEVLEERATEAITDALGIELPQDGGAEGEAPATLEEQLQNEAAKALQQLLGNGD